MEQDESLNQVGWSELGTAATVGSKEPLQLKEVFQQNLPILSESWHI